ncbi:aldehyde dehydrogenase [Mycobacterium intracellulare subsp. chimaera]|nr:aldehyde dehydrogenase [Mycobacterium intracellulare subsp. chimaera]KPN46184.1 aldehyde dehydrogenase [Mycobacterium intracellulare subsp. chimaera]
MVSTAAGPAHRYVDRDWRVVVSGRQRSAARRYVTESPATEQPLAQVPDCAPEDVDHAVAATEAAQRAWARKPPRERARQLRAFAEALREHREELATIDALDGGFPITAMRLDVDAAVDYIEVMCDLALDLGGRTIPASGQHLHYTLQQPYGVVARIVPYNHPLFFAAAKIAAPLVAGNGVVLKAPEQAPLSALRIGEIAAEVLPSGLLVVLTGRGSESGRALVRHPRVRRIAVIGSEQTGRSIQHDAADTGVKDVTLELGGKNAMLVLADADPVRAAAGAVVGMNFTATMGQSCGSTSRLLVHRSLVDEVLENVRLLVERIRIGDPLADETEMGPLITRVHYERVLDAIDSAKRAGAEVVTGGGRPGGIGDRGYFVAPTVLAAVSPDSAVARTEIFGPVLSVMTFDDVGEAVDVANRVEYGLTAAVWTENVGMAHSLASQLDAGYIWVNGSSRHFWGVPFGGFKNSGIGREDSLEELVSFSQTKAVNVLLPD